MELVRIINKCISNESIGFIYISLDTIEGSNCVGHWLWECALFLPYIKSLQKKTILPFKILLNNKKLYKTNVLSDFGFHECDIVYSSNMVEESDGSEDWQKKFVYPEEKSEYILYLPNFLYVGDIKFENKLHINAFYSLLQQFRMHYIKNILDTTKTIPILYIARSTVENYAHSSRSFINRDDFCKLLHDNSVDIIYTDKLNSFNPQFQSVIKSKILILEMGSAFTINAAFIATDSHIIIINDNYNYHEIDMPCFHIFRYLMQERNNTVEIFSSGSGRNSFSVDLDAFKKRIDELTL